MLKKLLLLSLIAALTACGGDKKDPVAIDVPTVIPEPIPTPPPNMVNLVSNGDFENATVGDTGTGGGVVANWNLLLGDVEGEAVATYTVVDEPVQDGLNALQVEVTTVGNSTWEPQASNNFSAPAGTITASVWVDGTPGATVKFIVQLPVNPWTSLGEQELVLDDTEGEFEEITFEITSDAAQELQAAVHVGYPLNGGATIIIDSLAADAEEGQSESGPPNRLTNPGFESTGVGETSAEGWSLGNADGGSTFIITNDPDYVQEGEVAAAISIVDAGGAGTYAPQFNNNFSMDAGDYITSVWLDGPEGTQLDVIVQRYQADYEKYAVHPVVLDGTEGFQEVFFQWSTDAIGDAFDGTGQLSIQAGYPANNGATIYVDNAYVGKNLSTNGGFESGPIGDNPATGSELAQGWNLQLGGDAAATFTLVEDSDLAPEGDWALQVDVESVGGALHEPQATHNLGKLEPGSYIATIAINGTPGARARFLIQEIQGDWATRGDEQVITLNADADDFETLTVEFTLDETTAAPDHQAGVHFGYGSEEGDSETNAGATIYIDNLVVVRLE